MSLLRAEVLAIVPRIITITIRAQLLLELGFLHESHLTFAEVVTGRVWHVLHGVLVKLLRHDIKLQPDLAVVALLKSVQLSIVSAPISVDLGLFVGSEHATHGPLAVDEAAVLDNQVLGSATAGAPQDAIGHLFFQLEDVVTSVDHH